MGSSRPYLLRMLDSVHSGALQTQSVHQVPQISSLSSLFADFITICYQALTLTETSHLGLCLLFLSGLCLFRIDSLPFILFLCMQVELAELGLSLGDICDFSNQPIYELFMSYLRIWRFKVSSTITSFFQSNLLLLFGCFVSIRTGRRKLS